MEVKLGPSTLPHIYECPCFEQAKCAPTPKMLRGTYMDTLLRKWLQDTKATPDALKANPTLTEQDIDDVRWAKTAILNVANNLHVSSAKRSCKIAFDSRFGASISGEMDAWCMGHVFDLKSGDMYENYNIQLLPYAYHMMLLYPGVDKVDTHLVYCSKRVITTTTVEKEEARNRIDAIVINYLNPNKKPNVCNSCKYCRYRYPSGGCGFIPSDQRLQKRT